MYSDKHEIPNTATIAEEELKARRQAALNNEFTQSASEVYTTGPITAETPMAGSEASSQVESSSRFNRIVRNHKARSVLAAIVAAGGLAYGIHSLVSGSSSSKSVAGDAYKGAVASCGGSTIGESDFTDPAEILPSAARVASTKDANKFNKALFDNELGTLGHTIVPGTEATMYSLLGYPGLRGGINSETTDLSRTFKGAYDKMTEGSKNSREQAAAAICAENQVVMGHVVSFDPTAITKGEEVTQIVPLLNKTTGQIIGETQKQFLSPQNYAGVVWKFANAGSDSSLHNFYEVIEPTSTNGQIYVEGLPEQKSSTTPTTTPENHSTPPTTSQSSAQVGNQSPSLSINGKSPEGKQCGVTCTPGSSSTPTETTPTKTTPTKTTPTTTTTPTKTTPTTTTTPTKTTPTTTTTPTEAKNYPPEITTYQYENIDEGSNALFCVDVYAGDPNESVVSVSASLTGPDGGSIGGNVMNEGNGEYCIDYQAGTIGNPNEFYINWSATNNVGLVANATEQDGVQQPQ
ncbi:hypothetical protein M1512_01075 [Patescibacteria group bacterium]|nr:hypothetical protein [Patescibacteria group bacterium]